MRRRNSTTLGKGTLDWRPGAEHGQRFEQTHHGRRVDRRARFAQSDGMESQLNDGLIGMAIAQSRRPTFFESLITQRKLAASLFSVHICTRCARTTGPVTWLPVVFRVSNATRPGWQSFDETYKCKVLAGDAPGLGSDTGPSARTACGPMALVHPAKLTDRSKLRPRAEALY